MSKKKESKQLKKVAKAFEAIVAGTDLSGRAHEHIEQVKTIEQLNITQKKAIEKVKSGVNVKDVAFKMMDKNDSDMATANEFRKKSKEIKALKTGAKKAVDKIKKKETALKFHDNKASVTATRKELNKADITKKRPDSLKAASPPKKERIDQKKTFSPTVPKKDKVESKPKELGAKKPEPKKDVNKSTDRMGK